MTIGRAIVICAMCGALLGLFRIHGGALLIAPAIWAALIYRRSAAHRAGSS